jgi:hypothetical protein
MPPSFQMMRDAEHLKLLGIFHYVMAGLSCLGLVFGGIYVAMGFVMKNTLAHAAAHSPAGSTPPPAAMADTMMWFMVGYGAIAGIISLLFVVGYFLTARYLAQRRYRSFCLVIAGISCLVIPFGTVLGIFTILVLCRPTVERLFAGREGLAAPKW